MRRVLGRLFIGFLVLQAVSALAQNTSQSRQAQVLYREAIVLFNASDPTVYTDSVALAKLLRVTNIVPLNKANAATFFDCYEKAGILRQTYGSYQQAVALYKKAIACCVTYNLPDSLRFTPYLYCGLSYYFSNQFDSSLYYLKKSESILTTFPEQQEAQRLYNAFGALYYEAGNYPQSINYFRKAVRLNLANTQPNRTTLMYGYKSNIASALRAMGQYNSSVTMYKSLIPLGINQDEVFINLGAIYLERGQPDSALVYLTNVTRSGNYDPVILENSLGNAYLQKNRLPDTFRHLQKALALYKEDVKNRGASRKNVAIGKTYKLLADAERKRYNLYAALRNYQQSIIQLDCIFSNPSIFSNPPTVTGGFRNYALFESLTAKARCLEQLYEKQPTNSIRRGTIDTYKTALRLVDYIEKSFDSEDARLFTVQKVFPVYQETVAFMIRAFEQTHDKAYLEDAFLWAEKSKAVALYINLKENQIKPFASIPDSLLKKEQALKNNLSHIRIKIDRAIDTRQTAVLTAEMQDNELALSRLANKLLDYPDYRRQKFSLDSLNIADLRRNLSKTKTALVSYFQAGDVVYCFVVTRQDIYQYHFRRDRAFSRALATVNTQLRVVTPGLAYKGHEEAKLLYRQLIKPAEAYLKPTSSLLVIPHNDLGLLPFDVLEDEQDNYLLEKFDVTYQYAVSFLGSKTEKYRTAGNTLAMAPFDSVNPAGGSTFARLPASDREIDGLQGVKLRYREATKENFLAFSRKAEGIHLATHAVADNDDPTRSFIAFYSSGKNEDKLYAHELRNVSLSNVQLVFLSACETASGKLINGEGVMSLSRAFSSAGCSNIVTSLWKAEDNATTYISLRFYAYLERGYSPAQALRRAKLDLLHDGQYAQFHSPQYWSHLAFIGVPSEPGHYTSGWLWAGIATAGALCVALYLAGYDRMSARFPLLNRAKSRWLS